MVFLRQLLVLSAIFFSLCLSAMEKERTLYVEIHATDYDYENNYDISYQSHEGTFSLSVSFDTNWERSDNAPRERIDTEYQTHRDFAENSLRESMAENHIIQQRDKHDTSYFNTHAHETQNNDISQTNNSFYRPHINFLKQISSDVRSDMYRNKLREAKKLLENANNKHIFGDRELKKQIKFIEAILDGSISTMLTKIQKGDLKIAKKTFAELKKIWPWEEGSLSSLITTHSVPEERFIKLIGTDIMCVAQNSLILREDYLKSNDISIHEIKHYQNHVRDMQLQGNRIPLLAERNQLIEEFLKTSTSSNKLTIEAKLIILETTLSNPITQIFDDIKNAKGDYAIKSMAKLEMLLASHFEMHDLKTMKEARADMIKREGVDLLEAAENCFASRYDQKSIRNQKVEISQDIENSILSNQNNINNISSTLTNNIIIAPEFHQCIAGRLNALDDKGMEGVLTYIDVLSNILQERSVGAEMCGEFFSVGIEAYTLLQNYNVNQNQCVVGPQDLNIEIINARKDALTNVAHNPLEFRGKSYVLNSEVTEMLRSYGINSKPFTYCVGNEVQQQLRAEFTSILNETAKIFLNELTQPLVDMVITCTHVGNVYAQENNIEKAFNLADCAWAALDCAKIICDEGINIVTTGIPKIATGFVNGCVNAISNNVNMIIHPVETGKNVVKAFAHLGYCFGKCMEPIVYFDGESEIDWDVVEVMEEEWKENVASVINMASQITLEGSTAFVVETLLSPQIAKFSVNFIAYYAKPVVTEIARIGKAVKDNVTIKTQNGINSVCEKITDKIGNLIKSNPEMITPEGYKISGANVTKESETLFHAKQSRSPNNINIKNSHHNIPNFIKDNRVPLDHETILGTGKFEKTNMLVKGARVYKKDGLLYHRDTLHKGQGAHLEVYNKQGKHLGIADPITGELIPGTEIKGRTI